MTPNQAAADRASARPFGLLRGFLALAIVAALLSSGCGPGWSARPASPGRIPVVVDTDMGADDILALLYLAGRPDIDLVGVTVVGDGLVHCPYGGANARAVLAAGGRTNVPVACGTERPMRGDVAFPAAWRTQADQLYGMASTWPQPQNEPPVRNDPVKLMADLARAHPGLRVLALGPLTTVAMAIRQPGVRANAPRIVVSGGALDEPGNMATPGLARPVAEWNIGIDPQAALGVLGSGLAQSWIPLDASNQVPIDIWFTRALAVEQRGAAGEAAHALLLANPALSSGGFYFWDPLSAVTLTDAAVVTNRRTPLVVITKGPLAGRTVSDAAGKTVDVAVRANPDAFANAMLAAYGRAPARSHQAFTRGTSAVNVSVQLGAFKYEAPATVPPGLTTFGFDASSGTGFSAVVLRLAPSRTYADVLREIAHGVTGIPSWITVEASADIPNGSRPTWVVKLPPGTHVVVAAHRDGSGITALGQLIVE